MTILVCVSYISKQLVCLFLHADQTGHVACASVAKYIWKFMLFNYCTHTARERQQASAMPRDKIGLLSIADSDRTASPASPISSLVYRSRYPRAIASLVIPTWVIDWRTVLPVSVVILWMFRGQSPDKLNDEKAGKEERWLETSQLTVLCVD